MVYTLVDISTPKLPAGTCWDVFKKPILLQLFASERHIHPSSLFPALLVGPICLVCCAIRKVQDGGMNELLKGVD